MAREPTGDVRTRVVHMVGYSHLDPVWLWPWTEGYAEARALLRKLAGGAEGARLTREARAALGRLGER